MNSVRAGMVESVADYRWSSYYHNALGEPDALITEHELYKGLGKDSVQRCQHYRKLFEQPVWEEDDTKITEATLKERCAGMRSFMKRSGGWLGGWVTRLGAHGGDRKSETYRDQVG